MKKTTYICDICGEHYNYIVNQLITVFINSHIIKHIGDVCDNCMGHIKNDVNSAVEKTVRDIKAEVFRKEKFPIEYLNKIDENEQYKLMKEAEYEC
jgi:hypothetical protein